MSKSHKHGYIYVYQTPASEKEGLVKIGFTTHEDVHVRIKQQLNTAGVYTSGQIEYTLLHVEEAKKNDGTLFKDHDIHQILRSKGINPVSLGEQKKRTEWFRIDPEKLISIINQFKEGKTAEEIDFNRIHKFSMRPEQENAVTKTKKFFEEKEIRRKLPAEMLWNAKMRFGKTFAAYQLAKAMNLSKVLVITYKPEVKSAWKEELESHVDFANYVFLSDEALTNISYHQRNGKKIVAFASYQDLLGEGENSRIKDKHKEIFSQEWDLLIIDEFHYGAGTERAREIAESYEDFFSDSEDALHEIEKAYNEELKESGLLDEIKNSRKIDETSKQVKAKFRLYLSGTPFKAVASARFPREAIFNWTYVDEQRAKKEWMNKNPGRDETENPYHMLPEMQIFIFKVNDKIIQHAKKKGKDEFSLNYFFRANRNGEFEDPVPVNNWLDLISTPKLVRKDPEDFIDESGNDYVQTNYPFDPKTDFFGNLDHTLWYLHRVESANALEKLLKQHHVFQNYHIVNVAGNNAANGEIALKKVRKAIENHPKTITLTVGKLTTGVTVPEWKAVLFLRDTFSPESYFQTAFRVQSPYRDKQGKVKKVCYVFDFSPNRVLRLAAEYNDRLVGDMEGNSFSKANEFVRYLPILKVDDNSMISVNAQEILSFEFHDLDARSLGIRIVNSRRFINLSDDTLEALNALNSGNGFEEFKAIVQKVKKYRRFMEGRQEDDDDKESIDLDVNNHQIKELKTKKQQNPDDGTIDEHLKKKERERQKILENIRETLKVLLSRLPIYMYLTDATEQTLEHVIKSDEHDLFRKVTGITTEDFLFLVNNGILKVNGIEGYVLKFLELESTNFDTFNRLAGLRELLKNL